MSRLVRSIGIRTVVIFIVLGIIFIAVGATLNSMPYMQMSDNMLSIMGGVFIVLALLIGAYTVVVKRADTDFEMNAIRGEAIILSREQTGMYLNNQPQVRFKLKISLPGQEPYEIEHKKFVNLIDVGSIAVGSKVPVLVDSRNNKKIEI